jgi:hypothetical protein
LVELTHGGSECSRFLARLRADDDAIQAEHGPGRVVGNQQQGGSAVEMAL